MNVPGQKISIQKSFLTCQPYTAWLSATVSKPTLSGYVWPVRTAGFPRGPPEVEPMVFTCRCTKGTSTSSHRHLVILRKKKSDGHKDNDHGAGTVIKQGHCERIQNQRTTRTAVHGDIWLSSKQNPTSPNTKHIYFRP